MLNDMSVGLILRLKPDHRWIRSFPVDNFKNQYLFLAGYYEILLQNALLDRMDGKQRVD